MRTSLGVLLWSQATGWDEFEASARRVDELGYDHLWTWDHLYAIFGDPYQPIFEGYTTLAAWAKVTTRARLGLLVGANTFRNPGLVAKTLTTIDHLSDGRAIAGIGGAWFELEHTEHGIDFGSGFGERLDRLDEAVAAMRALFAGEEVTSPAGSAYAFDHLRLLPPPVQARLPILIGGSGEKKTLRTVARYADLWNAMGTRDFLARKVEVLRRHCDEVGRDPAEIEFTAGCKPIIRDTEAEARRVWETQMAHNRTPMSDVEDDDTFWVGTPDQIADRMRERKELGFHTFIAEMAAPYDDETLERWIGEVRPMVDGD
ncbi:MAG TPA: LLM class flavin-dependent oxidoreductase [Candidatus Limnocylindria bacterium]|jgi:alkanesulfonate monooxygenase SsuD/methylene tetrahydromethanopterin reductase-like flavin-dependent oxidoreductase (luciferase family)|nr:LLM class flavin-dependent oxidoreductase [Candidatus Limnocylindria bacterium]